MLTYAGDLTLFAKSHLRMMRVLGALTEWCEAFGMTVNINKSELLCCHPVQPVRVWCGQQSGIKLRMMGEQGRTFVPVPWKERAR